jgi:hypothetical protein
VDPLTVTIPSAGKQENTPFTPAERVIWEVPPLDVAYTVVRARVFPLEEYVPSPTSQAVPSVMQ